MSSGDDTFHVDRITTYWNRNHWSKQLEYTCPYCSKYTRKDGTPMIRPKIVKHYHGTTCPDDENEITDRVSHCHTNREKGVILVIDENTERVKRNR